MCIEKITKARRMLGTVSLDDFKRYQIPDRWERRSAKKKTLEQTEALRTVLLEVAGRIEAKKNDREKKIKLPLRITDS